MPPEIKELMEKFISGSKNGTFGKCQGGDAMLEELNKESKSWLKTSGIPTNEQWLQVFRNIDDLTQVGFFKRNKDVSKIYKSFLYYKINMNMALKIHTNT